MDMGRICAFRDYTKVPNKIDYVLSLSELSAQTPHALSLPEFLTV